MDSETALSAPSTLRGATIQTAEGNDFSNSGRDTIKITVQNINIDRRLGALDSEQASGGNTVEDNEDPQPNFYPGGKSSIYSIISTMLAAIFGRIAIQPLLVVGEPTYSSDSNLPKDAVTDHAPDHDESEPAVTVCDITAHDILSSSSMSNIATEKYTRSILDCQCTSGYPLYEPRPDSMRSTEYWKKGVRIGDVGIVTKDGIFDFLFNVCPSQNPSINPLELPDDFETLECSEIRIMEQHFKTQTHLFNNTVNRIEESGIRYKCLGPEGAILELPAGATLFEAKNSLSFKGLASRHAEKWYRYTIATRGRAASNGSLYLVTSCIKCTQWGIAVFDRPSASQDYFQFVENENEVLATTNQNLRSKYDWKGPGASIAKVAMDLDIPSPGDGDNSNQCVFLRGYKIMLRKDVWNNVDPHSTATLYMPTSSSSSNPGSKQMRRGNPSNQNDHLRREESGGSESDSRTSRRPAQSTSEHGIKPFDVETLLTTSPQIGTERIFQANCNVSLLHPSDLVNAVLLSQEPGAKVALTHDDDWWNLLRDHEDPAKLASSYTSAIDDYGTTSLELNTDRSDSNKIPSYNASFFTPSLRSLTFSAIKKHTATVILAHGLGDSGNGLVPLASALRFDPGLGHVAWIMLDSPTRPVRANADLPTNSWSDVYNFGFDGKEDEAGILQTSRQLNDLIAAEVNAGTDASRIIIGGFSQGGAMSLLTGLTCGKKLGGIVVLSGWLPLSKKIKNIMSPHATSIPIFWGHGKEDTIVDYDRCKIGVDFLTKNCGISLARDNEINGIKRKLMKARLI